MKISLAASLILLIIQPVNSFTFGSKTEARIGGAIIKIAPKGLNQILNSDKKAFFTGMASVKSERNSLTQTKTIMRIIKEREMLRGAFAKGLPFGFIADHVGKICGYITFLNDPLFYTNDIRARSLNLDFEDYIEGQVYKYPITYDGNENPPFGRDWEVYFNKRISLQSEYVRLLLLSYYPNGNRVSSSTFDERSTPFGIGQVLISHAVSDCGKALASLQPILIEEKGK